MQHCFPVRFRFAILRPWGQLAHDHRHLPSAERVQQANIIRGKIAQEANANAISLPLSDAQRDVRERRMADADTIAPACYHMEE